jgi:hypothetical protein
LKPPDALLWATAANSEQVMKLGNILRTAGTARPVNPRPVEFIAKGTNGEFRPVVAPVKAVLVFLDEDQRQAIQVEARASIARRFPDKVVPEGVVRDEEAYHRLFHALRDAEADACGLHGRLADTVDELRAALVLPEAQRLVAEYDRYLAEEFPPVIDDETWKKLVDDAKKNSLSDLLTSYGFESVSRALSSLAGRSSR